MKVLAVSLLCLAPAIARMYTAKFEDCGSVLDIAPAIMGPVKISAVFNRRTKRHILLKGKSVTICINATVPASIPLLVNGAGLKNSAHGKILLGPLTVDLPVPFCSLDKDGCAGASSSCQDIKPGGQVRLCSDMTVPKETPDVDVEVTWKVLREEVKDSNCETEFNVEALKNKGKIPWACLTIPVRVQAVLGKGK